MEESFLYKSFVYIYDAAGSAEEIRIPRLSLPIIARNRLGSPSLAFARRAKIIVNHQHSLRGHRTSCHVRRYWDDVEEFPVEPSATQ